ncbi:MAG: nitroreductase family protein [Candidatus Brocadiia bacterium]
MANPIITILSARYASRSFSPKPLPDDVLAEIIEAARLTPSCYNKQPWRFLFLQTPDALKKGRSCLVDANRVWADRAPLIIVGYARKGDDCQLPDGRNYYHFDLGMASMDIMLCATHHNLVARPMAGYDAAKIRELFNLTPEDEPMVVMALGYYDPDESHLPDRLKGANKVPRVRKNVDEIVKKL